MASTSIPRFVLPRGPTILRPSPQTLRSLSLQRNASHHPLPSRSASTATKSKPSNTLERPSRFTPPSHPSRLVKPTPIYGPDLTPSQKARQAETQYPHTMPPPRSWTYFFLNSRTLHTTITLSILVTFGVWSWFLGFKATSPYYTRLPSWGSFFAHPIEGWSRLMEVYMLQTEWNTEETKRRRKRWMEDAAKAKAYRVLNGLEPLDGQGQDVRGLVERMRNSKGSEGSNGLADVKKLEEEMERELEGIRKEEEEKKAMGQSDGQEYVDFEGKRRPMPKKWLGIW